MRALALLLAPMAAMAAWAADSSTPVVVSAANPQIGVIPDCLATIYGDQLATQTVAAGSLPWPMSLGDIPGVTIKDANSNSKMASLVYVSPTQMNMWIPPGLAPGPATVSFPFTGLPPGVEAAALRIVPVIIQKVAPGLFSASPNGVAAASAIRVVIPSQIQSQVPVFQCDTANNCVAVPIELGVDTEVYLSLYGTGIRGASSLSNVVVTIGNQQVQPSYAGPQLQTPGLDQVNVPLGLELRGSGLVNVTVTADGVISNAVQINIQ